MSSKCPSQQSWFGSCPYANLLGVPGQGVHAARIIGLSLNDILLTIAGICITTVATGTSLWLNTVVWFVLGEVLHYAFGTQTAFLTMIGVKAC
jgi:hypothetical protein